MDMILLICILLLAVGIATLFFAIRDMHHVVVAKQDAIMVKLIDIKNR